MQIFSFASILCCECDKLFWISIEIHKSLIDCITLVCFTATNAIDSPILDVSRCPHCGKLFRGARSSISLQEHITNIHAAVAPITKFPKASSPSTAGAPSYHSYGPFDDTLSLACTKCSIRFDNKDELDKHHLVMHATGAVQVRQRALSCTMTGAHFPL